MCQGFLGKIYVWEGTRLLEFSRSVSFWRDCGTSHLWVGLVPKPWSTYRCECFQDFHSNVNLNDELSLIIMRPPSLRKISQQRTTFHNDETKIHWRNKNLNNELSLIMMRLPSTGVKTSQQRTISHNDETTIHLDFQSRSIILSPFLSGLPGIGLTKAH